MGFGVHTRHYFYLSRKGVHYHLSHMCTDTFSFILPQIWTHLLSESLFGKHTQTWVEEREFRHREWKIMIRRSLRHSRSNLNTHGCVVINTHTHCGYPIAEVSLSNRCRAAAVLMSGRETGKKHTSVSFSLPPRSCSPRTVRGRPDQRAEGREGPAVLPLTTALSQS